MPAASKADRLLRLQSFCSDRYRDIAVRLEVAQTGELGSVYGGRWDLHEARYCEPWELRYHQMSAKTEEEHELARLNVHTMKVSAKQADLIEDFDTPMIMANGSRRGGKSRGSVGKGVVHAAAFPGMNGEMISPTFPKAGIVWAYMRQMMPAEWVERVLEARMKIKLWNGVTVSFLSAHKPDALIGEGVGWIGFDEFQSITDRAFGFAIPALSDGGSAFQLWGAGTPRMGEYKSRHDAFQASRSARVMRFTWRDNPFIETGEGSIFDLARDVMDPRRVEQELEARFVAEEGLVYYRFDRRRHDRSWSDLKHKTDDVTASWIAQELECDAEYVIGVDYGLGRQFAVVYKLVRIGGYVCMWAIDEVALWRDADVQRLAGELLDRGYGPAVIIDDASGPKSEHNELAMWRLEDATDRLGRKPFTVCHFATNKSKQSRIDSVNALMGTDSGIVRWFVDVKQCPELVYCLENQQIVNGKPERSPPGEKPIHDMPDAMGYPIRYLFPADVDFAAQERRLAEAA